MVTLLKKNGNNYPSLPLTTAVFVCYFIALAVFGLNRPCWHDECHFVETVRLFLTHPSLSTLVHYNEMSTPLPFVLYAVWGWLFGDSLINLRVLSLIIAAFTYLLYYYFFVKTFSGSKTAFWLTFFLALNPYMTGAGIFVYTDMLTMFFLVLLFFAIRNRSPFLSFIAAAGGLLCRQYYVFVVAAAICYCGWCFLLRKQSR